MLCCVNKYSTWRGIKKSTKNAVKYLHLWRFRQNIKSSCTVKSPVLFLYFFLFFSSFWVSFSAAPFLHWELQLQRKIMHKATEMELVTGCGKNQPCGRSYSSLDEPSIKSIHVPKNTSKIFGIFALLLVCFINWFNYFWSPILPLKKIVCKV